MTILIPLIPLTRAAGEKKKGTMLMSRGNYNDALVTYDKCLSIQLQVCHDIALHPTP